MALSGLEQRYQPLGNTFLEFREPCEEPCEKTPKRSHSYSGYLRFQEVEVANDGLTAFKSKDHTSDDANDLVETSEQGNMQSLEESITDGDEASPNNGAATTIMIRNLPTISQSMLLKEIDESGFKNTYDFAYMPCHFETGLGKGYAFINFYTPEIASEMTRAWNNSRRLGVSARQPALSVALASVQGLAANMRKWNNPRMRRIRNANLRPFVADRARRYDEGVHEMEQRNTHNDAIEDMKASMECDTHQRQDEGVSSTLDMDDHFHQTSAEPLPTLLGRYMNLHKAKLTKADQVAIGEPSCCHHLSAGPLPTLLGRQHINLHKAMSKTADHTSFEDQAGTKHIPTTPFSQNCIPSYSTYPRSGLDSVTCPPLRSSNLQCVPPPPAAPPLMRDSWSQCNGADCAPPTSEPYIPTNRDAVFTPMWPTFESAPLKFANHPAPKGLHLQCIESYPNLLDDDNYEQDVW